MIKINKQQLEPIEEWIEKWGADLGGIAQVMLRIAVMEAIGKESKQCGGFCRCCRCEKDFDMRGEGTD